MKKEEIAITVKDLHVYYRDMNRFSLKRSGVKGRGSGKIFKALKGVSFEVPKGQILGICGKNGSGKSTLVKIIMGIEKPDSGQILFHGKDITHLSLDERARLGFGYAFQQPVTFKGITVFDLLKLAVNQDLDKEEAMEIAL